MRKLLLLLVVVFTFSACEKVVLDDESETGILDSGTKVTVRTRAAASIDVPLHVYAFETSTGRLKTQQTLAHIDDALTLTLSEGTSYRLVAVAADEDEYELPANPMLSSVVRMKQTVAGYAKSPLQMGFADIIPSGGKATISILLNYEVCSFSLSLLHLPAACSSASVSVASPFECVSHTAEHQGSQTVSIPCTQQSDGEWTTGEVYLFPTTGQQTVFTIAYNDGVDSRYASATYQSLLKAGVPYSVTGTYDGGDMQVSGSVTQAEWASQLNLSFSFSDDASSVVNGGDSPNADDSPLTPNADGSYTVSSIPVSCSLWQGHIVAAVLDSNGAVVDNPSSLSEATLLLLSRFDFDQQTSSLNIDEPTEAFQIADAYQEFGIAGWSIPTESQARMLISAYGDDLATTVAEAECDEIVLKSGNTNVRYLCEHAEKTFNFASSTVLKAGAKVNTYHLRLIREVKVKR